MTHIRSGIFIIIILMFSVMIGTAQDDSTSVRIAASWVGADETGFKTVTDLFTEQTGIEVLYEPDNLLVDNVVKSAFLEDPADIVILPRPGLIRQLVSSDALVPLDSSDSPILDQELLESTLSTNLRQLGTFNGQLYGLLVTSRSKSTIWYRPSSFDEYDFEIPQTWDELLTIAETYVENDIKPFALGGGDGWPLTDWFENIYIRLYGADDYNQLFLTEDIPWNDSSVQVTLSVMADMLLPADERLADAYNSILNISHRDAVKSWLDGDSAMYYEAGFVHINAEELYPDLVCGEDYDFFTFPEINTNFGTPIVGGGELAVVFNDTEASRAFMNFIASPEGATAWVTANTGSIISPNQQVDENSYDDKCSASEAQQIQQASTFAFDGSDLTSGILGEYALFVALQDYLTDPSALTQIMNFLTIAASKS